MKNLKAVVILVVMLGMAFGVAYAKHHTPEERGKTLFSDPKFAGGSKACNECHPGGKGLENAGSSKNLEASVNNCIVNANKGKAIDAKSDQMKDIVSYIKSLKP